MRDTGSTAEWRDHWPLVLAGALGVSTCVVHLYTAGLFVAPLEAELGWSRAEIASGLTIGSAVGVFAAPFAGRLVDLFGPRRVGLLGLILYGAGFASLGAVNGLSSWWLAWAFLGIGWGFIAPPVWTAAVAPRFDRGRGLALAVTLCGGGVTLVLGPLLARWSIDVLGWRASYAALAALWLVLAAPIILKFFADPPAPADAARRAAAPSLRRSGCLSGSFLQILAAGFLANGIIVTLTVHFVPILAEGGVERAGAAAIAALIGIAAIAGRLVTGWLLDRWPAALVGGIAFLLPALVAALLLVGAGVVHAVAAALLLGLAFGAEFDIVAYLVSRRFDLSGFGTLFGILTGFLTLAGGTGPFLAGEIFDRTGSYALLLAGTIAAAACASLLIVAAARRPGSRPTPLLAGE